MCFGGNYLRVHDRPPPYSNGGSSKGNPGGGYGATNINAPAPLNLGSGDKAGALESPL